MKKVVLMVMVLAAVIGIPVFGAETGMVVVSGTISSNLSLTLAASAYTMVPAGVSSPATITGITVKSNAKTSFTIAVSTTNAVVDNSFVAKATVNGTADGAVTNWPYKLFLEDVRMAAGTNVELTTSAPSKTFTRKTLANGDAFTLKTAYASAESLNLDAGVYSDTISITLTAL